MSRDRAEIASMVILPSAGPTIAQRQHPRDADPPTRTLASVNPD